MKHDKLSTRNFKKKENRRCKVCSRNATKGEKYCSEICEDKDKQRLPSYITPSPIFDFNE